jgi:hypothetical protein
MAERVWLVHGRSWNAKDWGRSEYNYLSMHLTVPDTIGSRIDDELR